jgi:hypothetical protein
MKIIPVKFYYQRARVLGYMIATSLLIYLILQFFSKA